MNCPRKNCNERVRISGNEDSYEVICPIHGLVDED